jgi:very-short-patch-repair endonuclease
VQESDRPLDVRRPFTRAAALKAGITPSQLAGRGYRRLFRPVYISAEVPPTPRDRTIAALLVHPAGARASHTSAARIYRLPVPGDPFEHISVAHAGDRRWQPGIKPHVSPPHVVPVLRNGVLVSPPARLFVELASMLGLVDLVVAGDALIQECGWTSAKLLAALAEVDDYWSGRARFAARFVREGVDSPMETRLRLLLVLAGLPEPEVNFTLRNTGGEVVARFDLSYPGVKLIIEYDGRVHVERVQNWEDDVDREAFLREDLGWAVLKVVSRGVYVEPWATVQRVAKALRTRGVLVGPLSDDYLVHFPGRRQAA